MGSELYDGTQPPPPPQVFPDPLAGLITGENIAGGTSFDSFTDDLRIAEPVDAQMDDDAIRAMVDSALADDLDDSGHDAPHRTGEAGQPPASGEAFLPAGRAQRRPAVPAMPGIMAPQQRQRPTGAMVRQALRSYPRRTGQLDLARPERRVRSSGASGVVVAIVLIVVFLLIALQVISGIIDSLTN